MNVQHGIHHPTPTTNRRTRWPPSAACSTGSARRRGTVQSLRAWTRRTASSARRSPGRSTRTSSAPAWASIACCGACACVCARQTSDRPPAPTSCSSSPSLLSHHQHAAAAPSPRRRPTTSSHCFPPCRRCRPGRPSSPRAAAAAATTPRRCVQKRKVEWVELLLSCTFTHTPPSLNAGGRRQGRGRAGAGQGHGGAGHAGLLP